MFARRAVATLKDRNRRLAEQRDYHRGMADRAQGITRRIAAKFTDNHTLGWHEAGRLAEQVDGHQNILLRHARLLKACIRYRTTITRQQRQIREKNEQLEALQAVLDRYHEQEFRQALVGMEASGLTAPADKAAAA